MPAWTAFGVKSSISVASRIDWPAAGLLDPPPASAMTATAPASRHPAIPLASIGPGRISRARIGQRRPARRMSYAHAPPCHVQPEPHAFAVADLPLLLQVLRVRDAQGASALARRGYRDPRPGGLASPRQGTARPHRREAGGERRGPRAPGRARPRGFRL